MQTIDPTHDIAIEHTIRAFLKTLNSAGGKPLEELSPKEARDVLTILHGSVPFVLPPANGTEVTITQDGQHVDLTIVRPTGNIQTLPVFVFFHGGGWPKFPLDFLLRLSDSIAHFSQTRFKRCLPF